MSWRKPLLGIVLVGLVVSASALAHEGRPVQVLIKEREPGAFLVQWRVPKVLPVRAMPSPVLPAHCRPEGERVVVGQAGWWLGRQVYRCTDGLAGHTLGIRYPLHNPSLTTVVRVELLSGERFAHALDPMEESWQLPEASAGTVAAWLRGARYATLTGAGHVLGGWVHVAFLLALLLLGGTIGSVRLVTAFAAGQLVAVGLTAVLGGSFDPTVAEICVAIAVVFLAREAFRPSPETRRLAGLAAGAGLFHGLALAALVPAAPGSGSTAWPALLVLVLGMDAALLVLALVVAGVGQLFVRRGPTDRLRPAVAYIVGGTAVAAALTLAFGERAADATGTPLSSRLSGMSATTSTVGLSGSRRVAPQTPDAPIQSYLAVEPFEVRHEVLVRLKDVSEEIDVDISVDGHIEMEAQDDLGRRVADLVASRTVVESDGEPARGMIDRVAFMTVDPTGVLPRQTPVREALDEAVVGVTVVYLTPAVPNEVTLAWEGFTDWAPAIPATVIDPESSWATMLTAEQPVLRWKNELMENPVPTVNAVAVEPTVLPVPLVSLLLFAVAATLLVAGLRGRRPTTSFALARVALALALITGPLAQVAIALPASAGSLPSSGQARRILASVLPNVYRALEFRDEATAYDRLSVAITGETLTDVYLEHRRALEMEGRGGARARVDAVEVLDVREIEPRSDGGFDALASWTVGGTVTHFGHRHFRQNRYDTRVAVVPVDGIWKIRSIAILAQERVR